MECLRSRGPQSLEQLRPSLWVSYAFWRSILTSIREKATPEKNLSVSPSRKRGFRQLKHGDLLYGCIMLSHSTVFSKKWGTSCNQRSPANQTEFEPLNSGLNCLNPNFLSESVSGREIGLAVSPKILVLVLISKPPFLVGDFATMKRRSFVQRQRPKRCASFRNRRGNAARMGTRQGLGRDISPMRKARNATDFRDFKVFQ